MATLGLQLTTVPLHRSWRLAASCEGLALLLPHKRVQGRKEDLNCLVFGAYVPPHDGIQATGWAWVPGLRQFLLQIHGVLSLQRWPEYQIQWFLAV